MLQIEKERKKERERKEEKQREKERDINITRYIKFVGKYKSFLRFLCMYREPIKQKIIMVY